MVESGTGAGPSMGRPSASCPFRLPFGLARRGRREKRAPPRPAHGGTASGCMEGGNGVNEHTGARPGHTAQRDQSRLTSNQQNPLGWVLTDAATLPSFVLVGLHCHGRALMTRESPVDVPQVANSSRNGVPAAFLRFQLLPLSPVDAAPLPTSPPIVCGGGDGGPAAATMAAAAPSPPVERHTSHPHLARYSPIIICGSGHCDGCVAADGTRLNKAERGQRCPVAATSGIHTGRGRTEAEDFTD